MDVGATSLAPVGTLPVSGYAMAFSPSCDQLAVGHSADGSNRASAYALDGSPHEIAALGPFPLPVGAIALSSDGRVAVGTNDGAVHLFDASGGPVAESAPTAGHDSVMCLLFAGDRVVVGHYHGRVRTLAVDGEALRPVESTQAATGAERERGSLDLDTGDVVMPGGRRVWALAATPRGVLALEESGTVRRLGGGASSAVVEGLSLPSVMALAPDGGHLLVAGGPAAVFALGEHGARFERAPIGFDSVEGFTAARDVFFLDDRRFAIVGFVTMRLFVYELPG
ncbi:MAG: hypothetical protein KC619_27050 [Myxococcales bacterium]|nr:hypothetical protein [Myxococcales bacterium]